MAKLTDEQREKLKTATARAEGSGSCRYTTPAWSSDGTQPRCVIGQLAFLEDMPLRTIYDWDMAETGIGGTIENILSHIDKCPLHEYPLDLLVKLQSLWDSDRLNEEESRIKMLEVIDEY